MNKLRLSKTDPQLANALSAEYKRQQEGIELIASENYVFPEVLEALGSVFTNKYSEGYPGKRYYGGQENTDEIELIAIERAKKLFGCDHANVQPHSGAPANYAVLGAWCELGDTILGMDLSHGGHLTHGHPVTIMSEMYNFVRYKIKDTETGEIDFEALRDIAKKNKPKMILAGYSSYPRDLDYRKFKEIADEVGAVAWADVAHIAGLIAAGEMNNPFEAGFHVVSTTTHKTLRGPRGAMILSMGKAGNPLKQTEKTLENLATLIDRAVFPGFQGGPHMNNVLAKAVAFGQALRPEFKEYAKQIKSNAKKLADELMQRGYKLVTNGTDNHLMVIDTITSSSLSGKQVEVTLDAVGLTASKSPIPDDPRSPVDPSGLRLGTPAMTTRGMKEAEMEHIARWIDEAITHREDEARLAKLHEEVKEFCSRYPLPV
ncbi:MAG: serine hydroxymethyltransferase [Candidatus Dojkabacteria bacterium]